jgi:hypothetical protein
MKDRRDRSDGNAMSGKRMTGRTMITVKIVGTGGEKSE